MYEAVICKKVMYGMHTAMGSVLNSFIFTFQNGTAATATSPIAISNPIPVLSSMQLSVAHSCFIVKLVYPKS